MIFIVELVAFQWGTAKLAKIGKTHGKLYYFPHCLLETNNWNNSDAHGHGIGSHISHGPEGLPQTVEKEPSASDIENNNSSSEGEGSKGFHFDDSVLAQVIGVAILEFGVILHRSAKVIVFCSTMI